MITKKYIDAIKKLISEGKSLIEDNDKLNTPECEAWKIKCLHIIKHLAILGLPDTNLPENNCNPHIALANLEIACSSASNWLNRQTVKSQPEHMQGKVILCLHCGNKTYMKKVSNYSNKWCDDSEGIWSETTWSLYFCPVCSEITLERSYTFSEIFDYDQYGNPQQIIETTTLYPHPSFSSGFGMPTNIKSSFEAAQKVRHIDGATCALSLRRTLEMVCKDKGETAGSLFEKLQNLSQKGILPPILDQMASILRELGNVAAHADDIEIPDELVPDLIEFTDTILTYLYVLPAKIQDIQSKMNNQTINNTKEDMTITPVSTDNPSTSGE